MYSQDLAPKIVPASRHYTWEDYPVWNINEAIIRFRHEHQRSVTGPARTSYDRLIRTLISLRENKRIMWLQKEDIARVKKLLVALATEEGWTTVAYTSTARLKRKMGEREGFHVGPNERVCTKCLKVKDIDHFRGVPTWAQKQKYGWDNDDARTMIHRRCSDCRFTKNKTSSRKRVGYGPTAFRLREFLSRYKFVVRQCKYRAKRDFAITHQDEHRQRFLFWSYAHEMINLVSTRIKQRTLAGSFMADSISDYLKENEIENLMALREQGFAIGIAPLKWWEFDASMSVPENLAELEL